MTKFEKGTNVKINLSESEGRYLGLKEIENRPAVVTGRFKNDKGSFLKTEGTDVEIAIPDRFENAVKKA